MSADGHETESGSDTLPGNAVSIHVDPPLFDTITEPTPALLLPTATQVVVVGELLGAQEIAWTLASGVKVAVVSHPGVAADAVVAAPGAKSTPARVSISTVASAETVSLRTADGETNIAAQAVLFSSKRLANFAFSLRGCLHDCMS
jgi:hypothetical protein